ncbi:MAG: type II toxin-antitoxin system HicA family toxin [Atribacterota bacterium]|nr:type II toxin-antitoxin system HicA family toxin [Atribacterota bacterium]
MTKKEKLLDYLCSLPRDFTVNELTKLMKSLGYIEYKKGKTSGSRIGFYHQKKKTMLNLHKPHPGNELKIY